MLRTCFIVISVLILSSCGGQSPFFGSNSRPYEPSTTDTTYFDNGGIRSPQTDAAKQAPIANGANGRVAILLPLSGRHEVIGDNLLKAAQLALFDIGDSSYDLFPIDTKGTVEGAQSATQQAINSHAKIIMGPLLGNNVKIAGQSSVRSSTPVIGFTTDKTKTGGNVFTIGILPDDQGHRMAQFANDNKWRNIAIITPNTDYANAVIAKFNNTARQNNINVTITQTLNSNANNSAKIAQYLSQNRQYFDAILMPFGSPQIERMAASLNQYGLGASNVPWLGSGIWDDTNLTANAAMSGAYFVAPDSTQRHVFEKRYQSVYGQTPNRLASLGYDAVALSNVLLRQNQSSAINKGTIMNPNGFIGIDGIFRFKNDGTTERGLAVHKIIGQGRTQIVSQAPKSFLTNVGDLSLR